MLLKKKKKKRFCINRVLFLFLFFIFIIYLLVKDCFLLLRGLEVSGRYLALNSLAVLYKAM